MTISVVKKEDGTIDVGDGRFNFKQRPFTICISKKFAQAMYACTYLVEEEWMGFIVGELLKDEDDNDVVICEKPVILAQTRSGAHAAIPDEAIVDWAKTDSFTEIFLTNGWKKLGWIHSHADMSVFWSSTDTNTIKEMIEPTALTKLVSIVVSRNKVDKTLNKRIRVDITNTLFGGLYRIYKDEIEEEDYVVYEEKIETLDDVPKDVIEEYKKVVDSTKIYGQASKKETKTTTTIGIDAVELNCFEASYGAHHGYHGGYNWRRDFDNIQNVLNLFDDDYYKIKCNTIDDFANNADEKLLSWTARVYLENRKWLIAIAGLETKFTNSTSEFLEELEKRVKKDKIKDRYITEFLKEWHENDFKEAISYYYDDIEGLIKDSNVNDLISVFKEATLSFSESAAKKSVKKGLEYLKFDIKYSEIKYAKKVARMFVTLYDKYVNDEKQFQIAMTFLREILDGFFVTHSKRKLQALINELPDEYISLFNFMFVCDAEERIFKGLQKAGWDNLINEKAYTCSKCDKTYKSEEEAKACTIECERISEKTKCIVVEATTPVYKRRAETYDMVKYASLYDEAYDALTHNNFGFTITEEDEEKFFSKKSKRDLFDGFGTLISSDEYHAAYKTLSGEVFIVCKICGMAFETPFDTLFHFSTTHQHILKGNKNSDIDIKIIEKEGVM